jgi:hypothetical protein
MVGGAGMGGGMLFGGVITSLLDNPAIGIPVGVASVALTMYGAARLAFTRVSRKRERELQSLLERVAQATRMHITNKPMARLSRSV